MRRQLHAHVSKLCIIGIHPAAGVMSLPAKQPLKVWQFLHDVRLHGREISHRHEIRDGLQSVLATFMSMRYTQYDNNVNGRRCTSLVL